MTRPLFAFSLFFLLTTVASAEIDSGPKEGEKTPALKVSAVVGEIEDKEVDYVAERKGKPTIYVFVQADKFDRPIARYLKELDKVVSDIGKDAAVVAVWLSDDQDASKTYLPRMQKSIKLGNTALTVSVDGKAGPNDWVINDRAFVTTIVAKDNKVTARFSYQSLNDTDVPDVEKAIKKTVGKE
ncbi:MAG: hypothetical protein WD768_09035 [Phycisphaeraceae bacterium]